MENSVEINGTIRNQTLASVKNDGLVFENLGSTYFVPFVDYILVVVKEVMIHD